MTGWTWQPRETVRALAPDAVDAFNNKVSAVVTAFDPPHLEIMRRRVGMLLMLPDDVLPVLGEPPAEQLTNLKDWPTSVAFSERERIELGYAEQFVIDVAGTSGADREQLGGVLGDQTFGFVQALYVVDHVSRLSATTRQLFGSSPFDQRGTTAPGPLWPAMERMMTAVMTIGGVDPLTAELVRLRGARIHNCRLCQSRRRVAAVSVDDALVSDPDAATSPTASDPQRAALALTDAILLSPGSIDTATIDAVQAHLRPEIALEIALLVAHNAANKIAVALGADAPTVTEGVEYFEVGAAGDYAYGLPSPL